MVAVLALVGCETASSPAEQGVSGSWDDRTGATAVSPPIAYVDGQAVTREDLMPTLIEAAGGTALSELALDRLVIEALTERGLALTPELIEQEKAQMLSAMSSDPDEAVRLFNAMRTQRGLGDVRFEAMLRRNAGLRLLVKDEVEVVPALLRQAYEMQHGERYRVRIIVAETLAQASEILELAKAGEPFSDLAAKHSTDASAAQGGLLSPISPIDPTYPAALRQALENMKPTDISELIAVDDRFIIMRLDEVLPADDVSYEAALPGLVRQVRRELEGQLMQRTARSMLAEARVVVLDPALGKAWRSRQDQRRGE